MAPKREPPLNFQHALPQVCVGLAGVLIIGRLHRPCYPSPPRLSLPSQEEADEAPIWLISSCIPAPRPHLEQYPERTT